MNIRAPYFVAEESDGSISCLDGFTPSGAGWREVSRAEYLRKRQAAAVYRLRKVVAVKSTVCCVLTHVASSGMSRRIKFMIAATDRDGAPYVLNITRDMAEACGFRTSDKDDAIVMGGCGMDMGFSAVYSLGRTLWPNGTPEPHGVRNGEPDSEGGYAIGHRWL